MASSTKQKGDLKQKLSEVANTLAKKQALKVGFLAGGLYDDGTSIPMVAAIQDFGAPRAGIPPRPFFRNAIANNSSGWKDVVKAGLLANNLDSKKALSMLGQVIVGQIQESLNEGDWTPLRPATIARKGFAQPLVDTGKMRDSVSYEMIDE